MQINELSQLSPSQYLQFVPKQKYNIAKSTVQKVKSTITSLNSGIVTNDFKQSASTPFSWVISANNLSIIDPNSLYFNCAFDLEFDGSGEPVFPSDLLFGNQFISSLFQSAELDLGGACICQSNNVGIDANMLACLKYDFNDLKNYSLSDRQFMVNMFDNDQSPSSEKVTFATGAIVADQAMAQNATGILRVKVSANAGNVFPKSSHILWSNATPKTFIANFPASWARFTIDDTGKGIGYLYGTAGAAIAKGTTTNAGAVDLAAADTVIYTIGTDLISNIDKNAVITDVTTVPTEGKYKISIRCKWYLSDIFYPIDSLDYIFNRELKITLTRAPTSNIICNVLNTIGDRKTVAPVVSCQKFELVATSYLLTDTARNQMLQIYSQPIETLMGVETVALTPLVNFEGNSQQTLVLSMPTSYNVSCILLAIPKCSNPLVPLSSNIAGYLATKVPDDVTNLGNYAYQGTWFGSNSNSYNFGGIKSIRVYNTSNPSLYYYDFSGTSTTPSNVIPSIKGFDVINAAADQPTKILDYREAYDQMKKLRLLFGKSMDSAMDYYTWMKDYCFIPIDCAGTNISSSTRLYVDIQYDSWTGNYNPLYYGNVKATGNQLSTNLLAVYLGSQVLSYLPAGTCEVKSILTVNPMEKNVNLVN